MINNYSLLSANHDHKGFTIVEIMVAITISMVLIAGVVQIYISSKESFRVQNELARLQENERIAVEFLQRDIRQAGYVPFGEPTINNRIVVTDGNGNTSDEITVSYTSTSDCLGQNTPNGIAINRYFIDVINDRLMCEGNGNIGNPQPIADGISNMQVLLGNNTNFANDSLQMPSADAYVNVTSLDSMINVVSVRIALLIRSTDPVKKQQVAQTFTLLDTNVTETDRLKRQVLTTTIPLRNNII